MTPQHPAAPEGERATGAIVPERQRCICGGICLEHCRACNYSGRDLEEPCIADPDWETDDDDLARRERNLPAAPEGETDASRLINRVDWMDLWWQMSGDDWPVPDSFPREFAKIVATRLGFDGLRERLRVIEAERDAARESRDRWKSTAQSHYDTALHQSDRAESAEAAHTELDAAYDNAASIARGDARG